MAMNRRYQLSTQTAKHQKHDETDPQTRGSPSAGARTARLLNGHLSNRAPLLNAPIA
jgi:hypothetical protein